MALGHAWLGGGVDSHKARRREDDCGRRRRWRRSGIHGHPPLPPKAGRLPPLDDNRTEWTIGITMWLPYRAAP
jgi:hypothetical protein